MKDSTFNVDFYVTAATVIPVLFLALTLQESLRQQFLKSWENAHAKHGESPGLKTSLILLASTVAFAALGLIAIFGLLGELAAIQALYNKSADSDTGNLVKSSLYFLMFMVVAVVIVKYWQALIRVFLNDIKGRFKKSQATRGRVGTESRPGIRNNSQTNEE